MGFFIGFLVGWIVACIVWIIILEVFDLKYWLFKRWDNKRRERKNEKEVKNKNGNV